MYFSTEVEFSWPHIALISVILDYVYILNSFEIESWNQVSVIQ